MAKRKGKVMRVYNFSAGPATLPLPVLEQVQQELLDWHGIGSSLIEVSHRGPHFSAVRDEAEARLRQLLAIPEEYAVLFLQGGATLQFAQVVMNLLRGGSADYIVTGAWSQKAYREALRLAPLVGGKVRLAASTEESGFTSAPSPAQLDLDPRASYVHLCTNETIHGVEWLDLEPLLATGVPLVADMSSHLLSRPIDVRQFGLIYAGAQKNIGPAGLTIVIVRRDLINDPWAGTPSVMQYALQEANQSMLNTPPTFAIYVANLVFAWLQEQGGLAAIEAVNRRKAEKLYSAIDALPLYENRVAKPWRSRMNVPFRLKDERINNPFLAESDAAGLKYLKGHKMVGGMRASIYNAMPEEGVDALVAFLHDFAARHG
jgi:phosphoserine aminotransferase